MKKTAIKVWDKLGICASGFCLVHCLATPFLLIFFPTSEFLGINHEQHSEFHHYIAIAVVISILMAVYPQCRKHGHKDILYYAAAGIFFVLTPIFTNDHLSEFFEYGMTIVGSIFLIIAHIKNMKVRHGKCSSKSNHGHSH